MDQAKREMDDMDSVGFADIILPSQFYGTMGTGALCSEQRLMLAVLVDAINLLRGWHRTASARKRRAFAEAGQWVGTRGTTYPFAFDSVCDALGIDSEVLRVRLGPLAIGHGAADRMGGRLRLKESSRAQHMTANRVRRRKPKRLAAAR